jgi:hypothetical protein
LSAAISALLWETTQQNQAGDDELGPSSKARHVVGAEKFLERRKGFVNPAGQSDLGARQDVVAGD